MLEWRKAYAELESVRNGTKSVRNGSKKVDHVLLSSGVMERLNHGMPTVIAS